MTRDTFDIMKAHTEFRRCHKNRKAELLKTKDAVKSDVVGFCAQIVGLKNFGDEEIVQPKRVVASFTKESTLDDWMHGAESARKELSERLAPAITTEGQDPFEAAAFLFGCLNGMSRKDNMATTSANRVVDRSVTIAQAAALCVLAR